MSAQTQRKLLLCFTPMRLAVVGGALPLALAKLIVGLIASFALYTRDAFEAHCRGFRFMVQVVINPASLLETGIRVEKVDQLSLFRFTDALQSRLELLLEKNETGSLTPEELEELTGIQELDRIFTYLNSRLIAQQ